MFFSANIAVEQEVIVAAIVIEVGLFARHALLIYKTQSLEKRKKMGRAEVIQTWVVYLTVFSTLRLLVCVCLYSVGT